MRGREVKLFGMREMNYLECRDPMDGGAGLRTGAGFGELEGVKNAGAVSRASNKCLRIRECFASACDSLDFFTPSSPRSPVPRPSFPELQFLSIPDRKLYSVREMALHG